MREADILYQRGPFWVSRNKAGAYLVWKDGITHATSRATFGQLDLARAYVDYLGRDHAEIKA